MLFAIKYWQRLFGSRGELYFAGHVRHAPAEMAALAADVRELLDTEPTPCLNGLYTAIDLASQIALTPVPNKGLPSKQEKW